MLKELIVKFAYGSSACEPNEVKKNFRITRKSDVFVLIICIIGLLSSYLLWGVVQERIVSVPYKSSDNTEVHFKDSLFLEFSNRIFSLLAAVAVLFFTKQPEHKTPIYKYSYNSFTCLVSSWCQYEALKYVTFPVQVLVKASKVIPVMAMGWLVSGRTYNRTEYFTAFLMSLGLFLFMFGNQINVPTASTNQSTFNKTTTNVFQTLEWSTASGMILMTGYIVFDSFTSNWQSELFQRHKPSHVQMMVGTNFFEILLASVTLFGREGFSNALIFVREHPSFSVHILCLSVTSACGQFFIFYTIRRFGPVTFILIMTVRQALSVFISCLVYQHFIGLLGIFGLVLFFSALTLWVVMK